MFSYVFTYELLVMVYCKTLQRGGIAGGKSSCAQNLLSQETTGRTEGIVERLLERDFALQVVVKSELQII